MLAVLKQRICKYSTLGILKIRNSIHKDVVLTDYYFGYGANLDVGRFAKNNICAEEVGSAVLPSHWLKFSLATEYQGKGYAGVHECRGEQVPGVLVKLDKLSLFYLDQIDGVAMVHIEELKKKWTAVEKNI